MLFRTSDYPAVFRRVEVLQITLILDALLIGRAIELLEEPHQYALPKKDAVMVLLEAYIVNPTHINGEYLPVWFDFHLQLRSEVEADNVEDEVK